MAKNAWINGLWRCDSCGATKAMPSKFCCGSARCYPVGYPAEETVNGAVYRMALQLMNEIGQWPTTAELYALTLPMFTAANRDTVKAACRKWRQFYDRPAIELREMQETRGAAYGEAWRKNRRNPPLSSFQRGQSEI